MFEFSATIYHSHPFVRVLPNHSDNYIQRSQYLYQQNLSGSSIIINCFIVVMQKFTVSKFPELNFFRSDASKQKLHAWNRSRLYSSFKSFNFVFLTGPWGLPLVGYVPLTRKSIPQQLNDLRNKHGDIFL